MSFDRPYSPAIIADECNPAPSTLPAKDAVVPLTAFQRQLLDRGDPPRGATIARFWEQSLWGDLDLPRLHAATARVAQRHALSRAALVSGGLQHFEGSDREPLVRVTDGAGLSEAELRRILASERERLCLAPNHDLHRSWQIHVLLTGSRGAWVTVAFSRVFFDRTSARLLLEDLLNLYHERHPSEVGTLEDFRAYAHKLHARHPADVPGEAVSTPAGPELPLNIRSDATTALTAERATIRIRADTWSKVRARFSPAQPIHAPESLTLAAVASCLALWSRTARFAVQLATDGRTPHGAPSDAPGQYTLATTISIDDAAERTFIERAHCLHHTITQALNHEAALGSAQQDLPYPGVAFSYTARSLSREAGSGGDAFVFVGASRPGVVLEIHAEETAEGALHIHFDHHREQLSSEIVASLATAVDQWLTLLAEHDAWQMTPSMQGWRLFPAEQRCRRDAVNATQAPIPHALIHDAFVSRARKQPAAAAVISPHKVLTYAELYGLACALASQLRERGVQPNHLVAIAAEKGWEQIVAAIGVTLSGAAYLPIDMELPADRMRFLVSHGDARIVLTQSKLLRTLPAFDGAEILAVDTLVPVPLDTEPPAIDTRPDDLAYVIFTSGSTGTPKGVMIEHRGAVNTIADLNARFSIGSDDRVLALSRLGFDLSVYDIFGLLAAGGAIVMPQADLARDPAHWLALLREHRVSLWNTVPALMQLLVDYAEETHTSLGTDLRLIWMSGDWIPLNLPARIRNAAPIAAIISMGGATEASIWSILYPVGDVDPAWRSIPYGKPMVNQTFHVLRDNLAPAPEWVTGELFIGGVGVARGYWKDSDKTAARFFVHPVTGERLYRTGDLGRFLPDGNIEFLGRADFQVKIRGYRIELGEIESALCADPRIRAAVVVARGDTDSSRHLVGYVVPREEVSVSASELQQMLRRQLPEYMVPPIILQLDRLPLTSNGKVDLRALPSPDPAAAAQRPPHARPTNEIEEIVLDLWRDILGVPAIGIHDDFFLLGGNSLSGTRMIIRLRAAFALPVPVQCLFQNPTIHRLANVLEQMLLQDVGQETPTA